MARISKFVRALLWHAKVATCSFLLAEINRSPWHRQGRSHYCNWSLLLCSQRRKRGTKTNKQKNPKQQQKKKVQKAVLYPYSFTPFYRKLKWYHWGKENITHSIYIVHVVLTFFFLKIEEEKNVKSLFCRKKCKVTVPPNVCLFWFSLNHTSLMIFWVKSSPYVPEVVVLRCIFKFRNFLEDCETWLIRLYDV